jgi:hypothetical protein
MSAWIEPTRSTEAWTGRTTSCPTAPFPGPGQLSPALRFLLVVYVGADWRQARAAGSARWSDGIAALQAWCGAVERRDTRLRSAEVPPHLPPHLQSTENTAV